MLSLVESPKYPSQGLVDGDHSRRVITGDSRWNSEQMLGAIAAMVLSFQPRNFLGSGLASVAMQADVALSDGFTD